MQMLSEDDLHLRSASDEELEAGLVCRRDRLFPLLRRLVKPLLCPAERVPAKVPMEKLLPQ